MKKLMKCIVIIYSFIMMGCSSLHIDGNNSRYFFYVPPKGYIPFSNQAIKDKSYSLKWAKSISGLEYGSIGINNVDGNNILITNDGEAYLFIDINSQEPAVINKSISFSKIVYLKQGIFNIDKKSVTLYSKDDLSIKKEKYTNFNTFSASKKQRVYNGTGHVDVSDNIVNYTIKGNRIIFYNINYKVQYLYSYYNLKGSIVERNTVAFNIFNLNDWSMTETTYGEINNFLGPTKNFFFYPTNLSFVDNGKYLAFTITDGENHYVNGYVPLKKNKQNDIIFDTAENIVKRFPGELSVIENKKINNARQAVHKSKEKNKPFYLNDKRIAVLGYKVLNHGILIFGQPWRNRSVTHMYCASFDLKKVLWKYTFSNNIKVDDGILFNGGSSILVADTYSDKGGVLTSVSTINGKSQGLTIPVNLSKKKNGVMGVVDWNIIGNKYFALYDERDQSVKLFELSRSINTRTKKVKPSDTKKKYKKKRKKKRKKK